MNSHKEEYSPESSSCLKLLVSGNLKDYTSLLKNQEEHHLQQPMCTFDLDVLMLQKGEHRRKYVSLRNAEM